jgi:hypothetical protein
MLNILHYRKNKHIAKALGPKSGQKVNCLRRNYGIDGGHTADGHSGCRLRARMSLGTCVSSGALHTKGSLRTIYVLLLYSVLLLLNL